MKAIFLLLSLVFVPCVTANTESRDLSGVNPEPDLSSAVENKNLKTAFNWKFWERNILKPEDAQKEIKPYDPCSYCGSDWSCRCECKYEAMLEHKIKVTGIGDQNPFKLLKESQDNNQLMLAADYDTCVKMCICEGGSSSQCHRVCEE